MDATDEFEEVFHSEAARAMISDFFIGRLEVCLLCLVFASVVLHVVMLICVL